MKRIAPIIFAFLCLPLAGFGALSSEVADASSRGDQAAVQGICKDLGPQHDVVDLVQALALILSDPGAIDRWGEGQTVFAPRPVRNAIEPRHLVAEAAPA